MGFLDKLFGKKEEPKMELAAPLAGEAVSISQVNVLLSAMRFWVKVLQSAQLETKCLLHVTAKSR